MTATDWSLVASTVLPMIGGGCAWVWNKVEGRRKELQVHLEAEIAELKVSLKTQEEEVKACHQERQGLMLRLTAVEAHQNNGMPRWTRNQGGQILNVSPEFVRLFCAPHGYSASDVIGKRFSELSEFSPDLVAVLAEMDREVLGRGYAARTGVQLTPETKVVVIKSSMPSPLGDVLFHGCAVPEARNG